jgi:hypothetical protein
VTMQRTRNDLSGRNVPHQTECQQSHPCGNSTLLENVLDNMFSGPITLSCPHRETRTPSLWNIDRFISSQSLADDLPLEEKQRHPSEDAAERHNEDPVGILVAQARPY